MARMQSSAAGVRSVTSSAGKPPATSASARGRARTASSSTSTGMTGARPARSRVARDWSAGVMGILGARTTVQTTVAAPVSALETPARNGAKSSRPRPKALASGVEGRGVAVGHALGQDVQGPGLGVVADHVAVAQLGDQPAGGPLGGDMDRRRHLARCARHAPIGHQRDLVTPALHHRERRRQGMELGHPVGLGALESDDHDHVAIQLAGLEGRLHAVLVGEDARGRLDHAVFGGRRPTPW